MVFPRCAVMLHFEIVNFTGAVSLMKTKITRSVPSSSWLKPILQLLPGLPLTRIFALSEFQFFTRIAGLMTRESSLPWRLISSGPLFFSLSSI